MSGDTLMWFYLGMLTGAVLCLASGLFLGPRDPDPWREPPPLAPRYEPELRRRVREPGE